MQVGPGGKDDRLPNSPEFGYGFPGQHAGASRDSEGVEDSNEAAEDERS